MVPLNATSFAQRIEELNAGELRFKIDYFNDQNLQFDLDLENPDNEFFRLFSELESTPFESGINITKDFDLELDSCPVQVPNKISLFNPLEIVMGTDSKVLLSCESHNFIFSPLSDTNDISWFFREMLLFADPTSKKILKALSQDRKTEERLYIDMNFFTIVSNQKEKKAQRGAVYRSITICTETLEDLSPFRKFLEEVMDQYMKLPPNDPKIQDILQVAFQNKPNLHSKQRIPKQFCFYNSDFLKSTLYFSF
jgi:hypothetical protein